MPTDKPTTNIQFNNQPYVNSAGRTVLHYLSPDTIVLDLHFILTQDKQLTKGMPYMKLEKRTSVYYTDAMKLLDFQHYEGVIYLNVQDLKTNRCFNLSWNMEVDSEGWWVFSLSDLVTLTDLPQ